jgi:hypothetical protein
MALGYRAMTDPSSAADRYFLSPSITGLLQLAEVKDPDVGPGE